jgi:D-3-phosphoglycerate dehydrogenase / 2-oxoglutarate reductase
MTTVLLADRVPDAIVASLRGLGLTIRNEPQITAEELPSALTGVNILVVRAKRVTAAALEAGKELSLVVRAGAGVNAIDVECASQRGIHVANCPGANADAVAELTLGLILAADRDIVNATIDLRAGKWRKKTYSNGYGLKTRTLGILGFGAIGRAVAERAKGFGMKVVAWSRSLSDEVADQYDVRRCESPVEVARASDIVSIHVAYTPETHHLVNSHVLENMRDGAILVNTSRGELLDTTAAKGMMQRKGLKLALDVFEAEPAAEEGVFNEADWAALITATPHIGASTKQTSEAIATEVVRIIQTYLQTGFVRGSVNICKQSPATHCLVVRHLDRVGVLSDILLRLREEQINIQEMQNVVFDGAHAAVCTLRLDSPPSQQVLQAMSACENILQVTLTPTPTVEGGS